MHFLMDSLIISQFIYNPLKTAAQPQRASTYRVQKVKNFAGICFCYSYAIVGFYLPRTLALSHLSPASFWISAICFWFLGVFFFFLVCFHCALQLWKGKRCTAAITALRPKICANFYYGRSQTAKAKRQCHMTS